MIILILRKKKKKKKKKKRHFFFIYFAIFSPVEIFRIKRGLIMQKFIIVGPVKRSRRY